MAEYEKAKENHQENLKKANEYLKRKNKLIKEKKGAYLDMEDMEKLGDKPRVGKTPVMPNITAPIQPKDSTYELESVGRLFLNLTKKKEQTRWKYLSSGATKLQNVKIWWDKYEKYTQELDKIDKSIDEADDMDNTADTDAFNAAPTKSNNATKKIGGKKKKKWVRTQA